MSNRNAAFKLFGKMRHSTPQEQKLYKEMLDKYSIPMGRSIWNMGEIEVDYCDMCHKKTQVQRKYYYYDIDCECCGGPNHFEFVRYCEDCTPKPPKYIKAICRPMGE